ncbi:MAG: hypothetical protein GY847_35020 [Proteobacteria bacterium]|nr:hypothetical protein [Pseudomonadota bacterium]
MDVGRVHNSRMLKELLDQDLDSLYSILGKGLVGSYVRQPSFTELIQIGQIWIESNITTLKEKICGNRKIRQLSREPDDLILAAAISDLIASVCIGVPPATVSVLLVKRGIEAICGSRWAESRVSNKPL